MLFVFGDQCKVFVKSCSRNQRIKDSQSVGFSIPLQQPISRVSDFGGQRNDGIRRHELIDFGNLLLITGANH